MLARLEAAQMRERDDQSHHAVSAHTEVADVVEEDDSRGASLAARFANQRADEQVRTTRLVDDGRTETIMLFAENFQTVGHAATAKIRSAANDDARRFAAGVRVDDLNSFHVVLAAAIVRGRLLSGRVEVQFSLALTKPGHEPPSDASPYRRE